jgi:high affinity Mn2+ porin
MPLPHPIVRLFVAGVVFFSAGGPSSAQEGAKPDAAAQMTKEKNAASNGDKSKDEKHDEDNGKDKDKDKDETPKWYSVHGQGTVVSQGSWKFHSPYIGEHSFLPLLNFRTTETATLYLAARVWQGGELIFDPEIAGGRGLSDTFGLAGFPNGEATRVGIPEPTPYIARLLFRQTIGLGGEQEKVEDEANQVAGVRDISRITFSIGKMGAPDGFDNNRYSHDPRTQFLNWSLMYNGAWDYPANVRGYTYGGTVEWNEKDWAVRYGIFAEPTVANGTDLDPRFYKANGSVLEFERRYTWDERPGRIRFLSFLNNAHMGDYRDALRLMPIDPDLVPTRRYRVKYGFGLNWEQELRDDLGVWARLGWNDGHTESWAFTEIDGTAALGLSLKGKCWCRPQDVFGMALVLNDISTGHRAFLAAGGIGFILGDGRLSYGPEEIIETYYNWELHKGINATLDFQGVNNPAYNRDRGPVAILGVRVHFEY